MPLIDPNFQFCLSMFDWRRHPLYLSIISYHQYPPSYRDWLHLYTMDHRCPQLLLSVITCWHCLFSVVHLLHLHLLSAYNVCLTLPWHHQSSIFSWSFALCHTSAIHHPHLSMSSVTVTCRCHPSVNHWCQRLASPFHCLLFTDCHQLASISFARFFCLSLPINLNNYHCSLVGDWHWYLLPHVCHHLPWIIADVCSLSLSAHQLHHLQYCPLLLQETTPTFQAS